MSFIYLISDLNNHGLTLEEYLAFDELKTTGKLLNPGGYYRDLVKKLSNRHQAKALEETLLSDSERPVETKKSTLDQLVDIALKNATAMQLAARRVLDVLDNMNEIFLPRDKLLGSAGVFPVYYWFIRSRQSDDSQFIREFLVRFDEERRANRDQASMNPNDPTLDPQLLQYDRLNRSTDDIRSHEGRFDILTERFEMFLRANRKKPTAKKVIFRVIVATRKNGPVLQWHTA